MTANFTLRELTKSMTATRLGFDEQFNPPVEVLVNLELLAENILQPLRDAIKSPIFIHSGYRCKRLNNHIGGSEKSQHMRGEAADVESYEYGNEFLYNKILELNLPYDQLINEFGWDWIHVSYSNRHRRQRLEAFRENGKTIYRLI